MDNFVTGIDTEEEAKTYFERTGKIFQEASINVCEWTSNHSNIMNHVKPEIRTSLDYIGPPNDIKKENFQPVRNTSRFFWMDSPATLKVNLFIRVLWKEIWTQDEELPKQEKEKWKAITTYLANATTFVGPRHLPNTEKKCLDIFGHSSLSAYASAPYLNGDHYMAESRLGLASPKSIHHLKSC